MTAADGPQPAETAAAAGSGLQRAETAAAAGSRPQRAETAVPFYLYVRPCRPLAGDWVAGETILREFRGAAVRTSHDGLGVEIVGRCDRSLAGVYDGRLPWVKLHVGAVVVPDASSEWTGDPGADCTRPLRALFTGRFHWRQTRPDMELRSVRAQIAATRDRLADGERQHARTDPAGWAYTAGKLRERLDALERQERAALDTMTLAHLHLQLRDDPSAA